MASYMTLPSLLRNYTEDHSKYSISDSYMPPPGFLKLAKSPGSCYSVHYFQVQAFNRKISVGRQVYQKYACTTVVLSMQYCVFSELRKSFNLFFRFDDVSN
ncbi:hypothetical protein ACFE04_000018 [Oxalis oulophora]